MQSQFLGRNTDDQRHMRSRASPENVLWRARQHLAVDHRLQPDKRLVLDRHGQLVAGFL